MGDENLHYTPFSERDPHVERIEAIGQTHAHEHGGPSGGGPEGRIVRVREMPRAAAMDALTGWVDGGATEIVSPAGTRALERSRRDTATGLPRLQRMAVGPGDPARVLNWSAITPTTSEDRAAWEAGLESIGHSPSPPPPPRRPNPHLGWTA
ncbi:MAG: hypothetical protein H6531_05435 [Actinobacteria bacterium]|nr:hypothetical protein [Thermoleophilia bacterium]MCB9011256.1 hypothetical protein [Actinomycetota bacterium]